jgi:hypothetical protein
MLVFLDESFRTHAASGSPFGVLSGIAIPEDIFHSVQRDIVDVRRPYHGLVLREDEEIHGQPLLRAFTLKQRERNGFSYHWNLAEDLLHFARFRKLKVFGVVCFRTAYQSFVCADEKNLDFTFRYLFERIDRYMKIEFPGRFAKLVFDNREHSTHEKNARAITNFFMRSSIGMGYDSIIRAPLFAVSQGHNYGVQLADLITTVIARRFEGESRIMPLWKIVQDMIVVQRVGEQRISSLKVVRDLPPASK